MLKTVRPDDRDFAVLTSGVKLFLVNQIVIVFLIWDSLSHLYNIGHLTPGSLMLHYRGHNFCTSWSTRKSWRINVNCISNHLTFTITRITHYILRLLHLL